MGCKEVEREELYWTDKSECVNCLKENSYLTCNTSYCKLWPPHPLSVQYKNSGLRRSLCHILNHDGLLLGRHQMIIYGFFPLPDLGDRFVLKEPRKTAHGINTYVLRSTAGIHCCAWHMGCNGRDEISRENISQLWKTWNDFLLWFYLDEEADWPCFRSA